MKKIVFATSGLVPFPGLQGSTVTNYSVIKSLLHLGFEVNVLVLRRNTRYESQEQVDFLKKEGINIEFIGRDDHLKQWPKSFLGKIISGDRRLAFEEFEFSHNFQLAIDRIKPDVIIQYTTRVAAASYDLKTPARKITLTVDLDHVTRKARALFEWKYRDEGFFKRVRRLLHKMVYVSYLKRYQTDVLKRSGQVITHAHQHDRWLVQRNVNSMYIPLPVGDFVKGEISNSHNFNSNRLKIIVVGASGGISTLWSYDLLCRSILPALEHYKGPLKFELHLIGNLDSIPEALKKKLKSFSVLNWRGYVDDLAAEIEESEVFFVPTFLDLGFRTRIAEAFSHGAIVVAHSANKSGMPELENNVNLILADTGAEVIRACEALHNNPELRKKLRMNARATFEQHYDSKVVLKRIMDTITGL